MINFEPSRVHTRLCRLFFPLVHIPVFSSIRMKSITLTNVLPSNEQDTEVLLLGIVLSFVGKWCEGYVWGSQSPEGVLKCPRGFVTCLPRWQVCYLAGLFFHGAPGDILERASGAELNCGKERGWLPFCWCKRREKKDPLRVGNRKRIEGRGDVWTWGSRPNAVWCMYQSSLFITQGTDCSRKHLDKLTLKRNSKKKTKN